METAFEHVKRRFKERHDIDIDEAEYERLNQFIRDNNFPVLTDFRTIGKGDILILLVPYGDRLYRIMWHLEDKRAVTVLTPSYRKGRWNFEKWEEGE